MYHNRKLGATLGQLPTRISLSVTKIPLKLRVIYPLLPLGINTFFPTPVAPTRPNPAAPPVSPFATPIAWNPSRPILLAAGPERLAADPERLYTGPEPRLEPLPRRMLPLAAAPEKKTGTLAYWRTSPPAWSAAWIPPLLD